jgi:hypothetical protein
MIQTKPIETEEDENKDVTDTLSYRINDLENFYADSVLSDDLKEIYAQIQENCSEFRNGVFFKMLDIFEADLVNIIIILSG